MSWVIFDVAHRLETYSQRQELKLAQAVCSNQLIIVKRLLQKGVDPDIKIVGKKYEPLIFLVFSKNWFTLPSKRLGDRPQRSYNITAKQECLRLLLEYGASPNLKDSLGRTVLEIAILWCLPQTVKLLLLYGADPQVRSPNNQTYLMKAAILGIEDARPMTDKLQIIIHLIDAGANLDAQTSDGKTALMYAVSNSRMEIVQLLVSSGASVEIRDNQGNKAIDLINQGATKQQKSQLKQILTQPQTTKPKYQQYIPEGDRLLDPILDCARKTLL
ncbi:ankyrin [Chondrocystis sp. NIES-4102]|nr:ankyrin [Chondrocystis sp. NIES-4102]